MKDEKDVVEVMARGIGEATFREDGKDVRLIDWFERQGVAFNFLFAQAVTTLSARAALAALEAQGYAVVKRGSTGVHHPAEPYVPAGPTEREPLKSMLEAARKHVMTDEEITAQRESWGRQMKD
jgi:hypothetical protein